MKGKQVFSIATGSYPFTLWVSIGQTDEQRLKLIRKIAPDELLKPDDHKLTTVCDHLLFSTGDALISLQETPTTPLMWGFLQHEIRHTVDDLFEMIGIKWSSESAEAFAYHTGYLTTEIYRRLK